MCRSSIIITAVYTLFFISTVRASGEHTKLTELIERIHVETNSATVLFYGIENDEVSYFVRKRTDIPVAFFTSNSQLSRYHDIRFFSNVIVVVQDPCPKCDILNLFLQKLHLRKFVIINANNLQNLKKSFIYLFKEKKFTRIYGITSGVAYAYLPYADIQVEEMNFTKPIPNALRNLNGYSFRTVAKQDLPRVFWYTNDRGKYQLGGYVGQLFKTFVQKHNATFSRADVKDLDRHFMMAVINATINSKIDISINAYQDHKGIKLSYPFKLMSWFIVAPLIGHLNPNHYFLRPFSSTVWISIGLCTFFIIVMDMMRNKLCGKPVRVWESFSENYLTLLASPTERPITRAYRFHFQVLVFSFVLVNLYLVYLTSYLTVYIKVQQHKTIRDLIDNKVPVLMVDYEWRLMPMREPNLEKIVILVEYDVFMEERNAMKNLNLAYALGNDKAEFFIGLQKYPKYHIICESLKDYYLGFIMEEHSHFSEILNDFIIQILDSGLMEKWTRAGMALIKKNKLLVLKTISNNLNPPYALSMFHLTFAWVCLLTGLTVALLIFVGEIFLFRHRQGKLKI